jgi:hypothetical protein
LSAESKFTYLFKNNLYAFQPKHLVEHHVYVPLPHVVRFHLESNGFEVLESATIGDVIAPKAAFTVKYFKELVRYLFLQLFVAFHPESKGHTQGFFVVKK